MTKKQNDNWMAAGMEAWSLGLEAWSVIGLRMMKIAGGGAGAQAPPAFGHVPQMWILGYFAAAFAHHLVGWHVSAKTVAFGY